MHFDYVYLGAGTNKTAEADTILLHESLVMPTASQLIENQKSGKRGRGI